MDNQLNHHISDITMDNEAYTFEAYLDTNDDITITLTNKISKVCFKNTYNNVDILNITNQVGFRFETHELLNLLATANTDNNMSIDFVAVTDDADRVLLKFVINTINGKLKKEHNYVFDLFKLDQTEFDLFVLMLKDFYNKIGTLDYATKKDMDVVVTGIQSVVDKIDNIDTQYNIISTLVNKINLLEKNQSINQTSDNETLIGRIEKLENKIDLLEQSRRKPMNHVVVSLEQKLEIQKQEISDLKKSLVPVMKFVEGFIDSTTDKKHVDPNSDTKHVDQYVEFNDLVMAQDKLRIMSEFENKN